MKLSCKSLDVFYKHSGVGVHCKVVIFHIYVFREGKTCITCQSYDSKLFLNTSNVSVKTV